MCAGTHGYSLPVINLYIICIQGNIVFDRSDGGRRVEQTIVYSYQECRDGGAYTVNKVITIISVSHNVPIYLEQTDIGIYHVLTLPTCIPNKEYPSSRVYYIASTLVSLLGGDMVRVLLVQSIF